MTDSHHGRPPLLPASQRIHHLQLAITSCLEMLRQPRLSQAAQAFYQSLLLDHQRRLQALTNTHD